MSPTLSFALPPIVDVHSHIVPASLPSDPTGGKIRDWPSMCCAGAAATMATGGKPYRELDDRNWSPERRLDHMDRQGIGLQALSPLPELLSYWIDPAPAAALCRHVNDAIAAMVGAYPTRFAALGMVPLQDVDMAIREAERIKHDLGFAGIEIGSNIDGVSPADARFAPFYEAVVALDLAIFVHGLKPAAPERYVGPAVMPAILGVPMDTTVAISSFIASGMTERHPRLRICFSHAGGAIGALLDRLEHVWTLMPALRDVMPTSPAHVARRFFYDIMTFSPAYTRYMIDGLGSDRFVVGTDFPAGGMALMDPAAFVQALDVGELAQVAIARGNGLRFLGQEC